MFPEAAIATRKPAT